MNRHNDLVDNLSRYGTLEELRCSTFFRKHRGEIDCLLGNAETYACPDAVPRLHSFIRVVQWNIEKGKGFAAILESLSSHEILRWADLILLNEADHGMNRSGNRHVARCLAEALSMNMAFGPAHLELTKGTDDEIELPGENEESLQGNAILSRYPILEARVIPLPQCFEPYEFQEKRYGSRNCVWIRLELNSRTWWVGAAHLEVRNTPRCRALQMHHILQNLPGGEEASFLLGGDLNTNGFSRGTRARTLAALGRLLIWSPARMKELFLHPERGSEPLFRLIERNGFFWDGMNTHEDTACAPIGQLEDAGLLPAVLVGLVRQRLGSYGGQLCFKLDWLLGRNVHALRAGEQYDRMTGVASRDAGCVPLNRCGPARPSDHRPIHADLRIT